MKVHRFVSNDFSLRVAAVIATPVVIEMQKILGSMPLATMGVGRTMVGSLLMASQLKPGQEVGLLLKGNGPLGSLYAQASYEGSVRGYCPNPQYVAPQTEDTLNLQKAMGFGFLTVSRQQPFQKQPHYGTVAMVSGEVGDDIVHYLHQSHQIRSLASLGVYLDSYGKVLAAGGILLEVMPGVEEALVEKVQDNTEKQKSPISKLIHDGASPRDLVEPYLSGIPFTEIPHDFEIKYSCQCSKDRVLSALSTMGVQDLQEMIEEEKTQEIQCQMCGRKYELAKSDLVELEREVRKSSMH